MSSVIVTPTPNLEESISFYRKLNFAVDHDGDLAMAGSRGVAIEINANRFTRAGVKLYRNDWIPVVDKLKGLDVSVDMGDDCHYLEDTAGTSIHLAEGGGPTIDIASPEAILGNYAGISLETLELSRNVDIWEILGFEITGGTRTDPWVSLKNEDGMIVTIMKPRNCPHLFFNPSLTYFNGESNMEVIANIRKAGIPITEEITHFNKEGIVDNIIIRDPGGLGFFIFND